MTRAQRLQRIVDLVVESGSIHIDAIIETLGVSAATARRDLDELASQQLVIRTRGGALANSTTGDVPLRYRGATRTSAKQAIARAVADMTKPNQVVAFNGGTTTTTAAYELGVRVAAEPDVFGKHFTVVTNAVNIAADLAIRPQIRVVVTGGVARPKSYELVGPLSDLILPQINIDVLFLGVTAVDTVEGLFTPREDEAAIGAALVAAARRTVVITDSSKINTTAFARICTFEQVDAMITDTEANPDDLATIAAHGVEVITVS